MGDEDFDEAAAHRRFATSCFNRTWDLLDRTERSDADEAEMIHMAHASRWHWGHVPDKTPSNLAVGAWQLSRVYAVAGRPDEAMRYGEESLQIATERHLGPFLVGYGHEAIARAASMSGDTATRDRHRREAAECAERIEHDNDRAMLLSDLQDLA
jgi:hypothetical protein